MILVDTNVWSENSKANGFRRVLDWIDANRDELWLSTIVVAEFRAGIRAGIENPAAIHKRGGLQSWLTSLEATMVERTLPFDSGAAHVLGRLLIVKSQDNKMLDTLLAAQALSRNCPVATRNVRDFEWTGVKLINPWQA